MSDGTGLRREFLLDSGVTFLNHGSFGACPRAVFERYQRWQRELERQPVLFLARRLEELLAEASAALGDYVGADPEDLGFVPNATAAVNVAAWGSGSRPATRCSQPTWSTARSTSPGNVSATRPAHGTCGRRSVSRSRAASSSWTRSGRKQDHAHACSS